MGIEKVGNRKSSHGNSASSMEDTAQEAKTARDKDRIILAIGKICRDKTEFGLLSDDDKKNIKTEIGRLDKQRNCWFSHTKETKSKVYACVLIYRKFNPNPPTSWDQVRKYIEDNFKGEFEIKFFDDTVRWNRSDEYFKQINDFMDLIKKSPNEGGASSTNEHSFNIIIRSFDSHKTSDQPELPINDDNSEQQESPMGTDEVADKEAQKKLDELGRPKKSELHVPPMKPSISFKTTNTQGPKQTNREPYWEGFDQRQKELENRIKIDAEQIEDVEASLAKSGVLTYRGKLAYDNEFMSDLD